MTTMTTMTTIMMMKCGARGRWAGGTMMLLLAALLATAGCGRERAEQAPPVTAQAPPATVQAQVTTPRTPATTVRTPTSAAAPEKGAPAGGEVGPAVTSDNGLKPAMGAVPFTSREAGFSAIFPAGCPKISTRSYPGGAGIAPPEIVQCYCDLAGRANEGVMVSTYLALRDERGGPPNPRNVTTLIEELARKFNLRVMRQGPVIHPDYEGVRAFCRETNGQGEMWVQGMLIGDRVFIMTAWRRGADGLNEAQATRFFESFRIKS
jgi:predicted small lipoprotein YifL